MAEEENKEQVETEATVPTTPVKHKRQWYTLLLKVRSILSSGNYGRLSVETISKERLQIVRWNLGDADAKKMLGKWFFILVELRKDELLYYNRAVPVQPTILELIKHEEWKKTKETLAHVPNYDIDRSKVEEEKTEETDKI